MATGISYRDESGLTSRANGALLQIDLILNHRPGLTSPVRLALIAEVLKGEPILTDMSVGAIRARQEAGEARQRQIA